MIDPVKKVQLFVLDSQTDQLLKLLQRHQIMMISDSEDSFKQDVNYEENMLVRVKRMIKYLETAKKKKAFFDHKETTYEALDYRGESYLEFLEEVENLEQQIDTLQKQNQEIEEKIKVLTPFKENDLNMLDMASTKYVTYYHGFIYEKTVEQLEEIFKEHNIPYCFFNQDERGVAVTFALYKQDATTFYQEIRRHDFKEVELPKIDLNVSDYLMVLYQEKTEKLESLEKYISLLEENTQRLNDLYIYADQLASDRQRKLTPLKKAETRLDIINLTGWVREKDVDKLHKLLEESKLGYEIEVYEPAADEVVPTALANNKVVENFEFITEQYSIPTQQDLDPTPSMSFWYWILFGMMMGDVGYGIVMVLGIGLFLKLKKPKGNTKKLLKVIYYSGYTTILFGLVYSSFFGYDIIGGIGKIFNQEWKALITPIDNALEMLIVSIAIGVIQIIHGLILKAVLLFKLKDPLGALAEGISYIFILLGIGFFALGMIVQIPSWVGISMMILGVVLILVFSGRRKKKVMQRVTAGLSGVYNIISQLSDVLSYSRILALALSTAVIGYTFNLLAGMVQVNIFGYLLSFIIYIIGHVFNFAMGMLSTYIHNSRLQYIEFFGKFYEGGGVPFIPLALELNYIDEIININNIGGI